MMNDDSTKKPLTRQQEEDEFDEWFQNTDLGPLLKDVKGVLIPPLKTRMGRPKIGKKITLTLPEETIEDLRKRAAKKGMGYQTFARMILMELPPDEDRKTGT